ncbi:MAG: hypothetical protein MSS49_08330 [Subdoligranulum variabile]|uniref:hypothetical protein n=1 Tax=Gemmiger sp. TaxID=2049027 RepID=UPI002A7F1B1C|nr:hypothetical protein [Gemmiger sp.]MCI7642266.1 hypothetical protein [Subdoligranulum variabile]MDD6609986.1 hypothetical protein [Subdoligranulum variabile]MDY4773474.1 hypothetical protein [Gemmiger sp.]MDY5410447.1 hypothetical protein [Gemmiger sp.]
MRSIKTKLFSLGMAAAMLLALGGCAMSTPANVGSIGGVEIPAGVYLLAQYNSYNTASGLAKLATGETASDVKAVLKAECTGTINGEEVTTDGADYVSQLTTRAIEYYAAVEKEFDELGGTLDDAATAEAANSADSLWSSNGDLYTANGISKSTVETYLLNAQKAKTILNLTYGADGTTPVTEAEYTDYVNNECYYVETVQFPLVNYSSYSLATDDQKAQIGAIAAQCQAELNEQATAETASNSALYTAAMTYVPQAMSVLGSTMESAQAVYYAGSQLYTPNDLASFGSDSYNDLTDPLDEVPLGSWTTIDLGTTMLVARRIDPFKTYTVDELNSMYDMLTSMKSDEIQSKLYADGAALEHNLNTSAINTYSASKIKKTVK